MLTSVGDDIELYENAYTRLRNLWFFLIILDIEAFFGLFGAWMRGNIQETDCLD